MKRTAARILCLLMCAMALLAPVSALAAEEQSAPNVIELMKTYTQLDLTPYEGKAIYLNFFTEWCYYCMQEMPDIKTMYETYDPEELQIVLVHVWDGEDASNTESVKKAHGLEELTFFEDKDGMVASLVGLQGYPASLYVNKDGTLAAGYNYALSLEQLCAPLDAMGVARRADAQ